jgi:hypothetical protein
MSLSLDEVGIIDISSLLDAYDEEEDGRDEVLISLRGMWKGMDGQGGGGGGSGGDDDDGGGKRLAILAGIVAHLQLTRYADLRFNVSGGGEKSKYALDASRRLSGLLDAMPLLPRIDYDDEDNRGRDHPFPTHYLFWSDDEIDVLLRGTIGQTKAREVRAGIGLVIREWSPSFLAEHDNDNNDHAVTRADILNAIFSAFAAVLSRSFGDSAGRDLGGMGRMLVPLVDMLNHDGEEPNVCWTWHLSGGGVGGGDGGGIVGGMGDIVVTTTCEVKGGEELLKCYGWRPSWDVASSYGFVPRLVTERWECTAIPLFPPELDLSPSVATTEHRTIANRETILDLLLESNYGPMVKAVVESVEYVNGATAKENRDDATDKDETINKKRGDRPEQLDRLQLVSLFRPPPKSTADEYPFLRRQPCVVVGTKIQSSLSHDNDIHHRDAIESILPPFRAAACVISKLRDQKNTSGTADTSQIVASRMMMAAGDSNWDAPARRLIIEGISDRIRNLVDDGANAKAWLAKQNDATGMTNDGGEHHRCRAYMAGDVREAELKVLRSLQGELLDGKT